MGPEASRSGRAAESRACHAWSHRPVRMRATPCNQDWRSAIVPDLRSFVAGLEAEGDLVRIREPLSRHHELAAVLYELGRRGGPAAVAEHVDLAGSRVVGNLLGTRRRLARALAVAPEDVGSRVLGKQGDVVPPRQVSDGPVQEFVQCDDIDLRRDLPALVHSARDACPYITAGVVFSRHPETGELNCAVHRVGVTEADRATVALNQDPTRTHYRLAEERGLDLEVAVAIGVAPALLVAACAPPTSGSKLGFAGALAEEPVELVNCRTVDVEVPASAEWVIEGRIHHGRSVIDGPMGGVTGYYLTFPGFAMSVSAVTRRSDAVYQALHPFSSECANLVRFTAAADALERLRMVAPGVTGVSVHPGIFDDLLVVGVQKESGAQVCQILYLALSSLAHGFKLAVAVDEDVDIESVEDVVWALLTRFRPDRDVVRLEELPGGPLDPCTAAGSTVGKLGFDATRKEDVLDAWERARPPRESLLKVRGVVSGIRGATPSPFRLRAGDMDAVPNR